MNHPSATRSVARKLSWLLTALVLLACWLTESTTAQEAIRGLPQKQANRLEQLVEQAMSQQGIPGLSLAIGQNQQVVYEQGFGQSDVENQVPATYRTRYRTASIAKPISAVAVMSLVADQKIKLDQPVQAYCPEYPEKKWPLTVRQVMGHLGGVRHYKSAAEARSTRHFTSLKQALAVFKDDELLHEPGTRYRYTTFGYNLLGSVAEGAGQETFPKLLEQRVFAPAGMTETVVDNVYTIVPHRTRGYQRSRIALAGGLGALQNCELHDTSMKIPGGGLLSTASDLVRFAQAVQQGKVVPPRLVEEMWQEQKTTSGQPTGYGLGWGVGEQFGKPMLSHTGGQAGTSTILVLFPKDNLAIAVMCNLRGASLRALARSIAEELL